MKICSKCKIPKELEDFPINRTKKDGRAHICKKCQNEYVRQHYKKNKKQYYDRNIRRKNEAREYVINFKKNGKCGRCPEHRWWVLDFHHTNNKKDYITRLFSYGIDTVKREIEKCELLCANCHRDLHYQEKTLLWCN